MAVSDATRDLQRLIDRIRLRLRDYEAVNRLIAGKENPDTAVAEAIQGVVDEFNGMEPVISASYSWDTFPNKNLLISGACAILQMSVGRTDIRNTHPVQVGPVAVPSRQKGQVVYGAGAQEWASFLSRLKDLKRRLNWQEGMGGARVRSPYGVLCGDDILQDYVAEHMPNLDRVDPE